MRAHEKLKQKINMYNGFHMNVHQVSCGFVKAPLI
jgi:hypothetical protein